MTNVTEAVGCIRGHHMGPASSVLKGKSSDKGGWEGGRMKEIQRSWLVVDAIL